MKLIVVLAILIGSIVLACSSATVPSTDLTLNSDATVEARVAKEPVATPAVDTPTPALTPTSMPTLTRTPVPIIRGTVSPELLTCVKTALGEEQYNAIIAGRQDAVAEQLGMVFPCILEYPQEANSIMEMFGPDSGTFMAASTPIPNTLAPSPTSRLIGLGWNKPTSVQTTYLKTSDLSDDSVKVVEDGIQAGEDYLGSYGPLRVYVIGTDVEAAHLVAIDFCSWAYGGVNGDRYEYCVESDQGIEIREIAEYAGSNAFAQHSRNLETPNQSFVIGNPLQFEPGLGSKIAIHEYVHIYQNANKVDENDFGLPLWLEEGSAEFLALYLGQKKGWADFRTGMTEALRSAKDLKERHPDIGIQYIETSESRNALQSICDCTGMLQYETGQWATAWLANRTSLDIFYKSYIPDIVELGGHGSFETHFGLTIQEFYGEFDEFMSSNTQNQLAILPAN